MLYEVSIDDAKRQYPEYEFVSRLTASAQKAAFHVRDSSGRDLCLKLIAPNTSRDRLDREILALQQLNHPNVARLDEYLFESKGGRQRHHIVEIFIPGVDLSSLLVQGIAWKPAAIVGMFSQIADGLEALGHQNIVHRDLKPSNIRVMPNQTPVIIDLGLARMLDRPDLTATADGAAIGTPLYFAPEQFLGDKRDIDCRTDLFALGILLHQAATGSHPFYRQGMTRAELQQATCQLSSYRTEVVFASLPTQWQVLINRLLEKQRVKRPRDAAQVRALLTRIGGMP